MKMKMMKMKVLTVDGEGLRGAAGADGVANGTRVLPGVAAATRVDDQRPSGDADPGAGGEGGALEPPGHRHLRPRGKRAGERDVATLHRHRGHRQTHPRHRHWGKTR